MGRKLALVAAAVLVAAAGGVLTLAVQPPELLRVGANYGAKTVCSNLFVAGREAQAVLADDVLAPGHPVLRYLRVNVDRQRQLVRARFLGFIGDGLAVHRPGTGCAAVPDGDVAQASRYQFKPLAIWAPSPNVAWPTGSQPDTLAAVQAVLDQDALAGPGMRGIAVVYRGRLVGQRYGAGYTAATPLLGWSLTKTVSAAMIGIAIADGKLAPQQSGFWPDAGDARSRITLAQLMAMSSGLQFNEGYGDVSDLTRMLYLAPDMAAYTAAQPLAHPPGSAWHYASGTTVLLSRIWQRALATPAQGATSAAVLSLPRQRLFAPLGMSSAVIEADARGNLVGSSYMYASTQDWARFGQFLLQDGVWQGKRILPEGYVAGMRQPAPASDGRYGQGQVWRRGPSGATADGRNPDLPFKLPADTYWMEGHDGQSVAIVPSLQLVVVRLGLTPQRLLYQPQAMLAAVVGAVQ